ncbi:HIT-like domain-containing protein [Roridomyces roridus]|uniref:HIT-like domain-containing protein n=1 Tax=Roridomyces roridus TaxID=1738132 RepID=A0AAD7CKX3_9AGAR|nr:HIT-like domain-containing protein [Roridomyces roridus]
MGACPFCDVSEKTGFRVIWEDETFTAFRDRKPAAEQHIQVIPKKHIVSVRSLRKQDADFVKTMKSVGDRLLDDLDVPQSMRVMGFHIPPFNSINHLHLHVQGLPYKPMRKPKYTISSGFGPFYKGFGWFVTAEQTVKVLETGRTVGVLPC